MSQVVILDCAPWGHLMVFPLHFGYATMALPLCTSWGLPRQLRDFNTLCINLGYQEAFTMREIALNVLPARVL